MGKFRQFASITLTWILIAGIPLLLLACRHGGGDGGYGSGSY